MKKEETNSSMQVMIFIDVSIILAIHFVRGSLSFVTLFKKILEPVCWEFKVSFESIFEIYIDDAKPNSVTISPLKVIKQWPCKVSLHLNALPARQKKKVKLIN